MTTNSQPVPRLVLEDLGKRFGETTAVQGVGLTVGAGQIWGLIGPNGAGKTTTLRMAVGLLRPTHGRVLVDGLDVVREPVATKRVVGFVTDVPQLFEVLTVAEHLDLVEDLWGLRDDAATAARRTALLERFELAPHVHKPASALSRGMRQKVLLCATWLRSPRLILLDEPFTGLDPAALRQLGEAVQEAASAGAAVIVSSHLLERVEGLATHVAVMVNGVLRFAGSTAEAAAQTGGRGLEEAFFRVTSAAHDAQGAP